MINFDKYRVATNFTEYLIVSHHFKIYDDKSIISCKNCKKLTYLDWMSGLFGHSYQVARLSTFIIPN